MSDDKSKRDPFSTFPALPCNKELCIYSGKKAMCEIMDKAGVPNQGKWRSLILYFRSLSDQDYLEQEQQKSMRKLVIQVTKERDYSDERYSKLIKDMHDIMNSPLKQKLQEALMETAAIAEEYSIFLDKNKNRVSDLGETTVRDIQSGIDPEIMIQNIQSSFREVISGMEKDIAALKAITKKDGLTGLHNRRSLDAFLADMLINKNTVQPIQVLLLDLDHFKNINDTYGHLIGDYVLQAVADTLKKPGKQYDNQEDLVYFPARFGGEEFAICLSGFDLEQAVEIGESLRKAVQHMNLTIEDNNGELVEIDLSISLGLAQSGPLSDDPVSDILRRADAALYKAKNKGRNQLEIDENSR
ncbi:GGDEF domain-containing protein [Maridesulfovibrio sp.]|uniref:GGDEF domain-containing protein n=1 Tax=Maridesulfovibrio sp. TaxID=2795000 RepID=UPI0039EFAD11